MSEREFLGLHGVVVVSEAPAEDAARWARRTRLPVLRRGAGELRLGLGPELFVAFRKGRVPGPRLAELHFAVRDLGGRGRPDDLGGDSLAFSLGGVRVVLRQFRRPPRPGWASARRGPRPRSGGKAPARSRRRGSRSGA